MIKRIKFLVMGYIVLLDTETSMLAYIMEPWNKKPLQWMEPTHLAYGCSACDCKACHEGYHKDYGPCGRLLSNEFSHLPYDLNCFHIVRDEKIIAELNKKVSQLDLNVIDVYLDDGPRYDEFYNSWKHAVQDLCKKKGLTLYHHRLDGVSYQIHAGGISVNGYLSLKSNKNLSDLKAEMYMRLYFALKNDADYRQREDDLSDYPYLELKLDRCNKNSKTRSYDAR